MEVASVVEPATSSSGPIRSQYLGHGIRLDQSEDRTATSSSVNPAVMAPSENDERTSKKPSDDKDSEYVLKWGGHNTQLLELFSDLLSANTFTDVSLEAESKTFHAHQLVLSACSPYFRNLFITSEASHQTVFCKDISSQHMGLLLDYMYKGSISVKQEELQEILRSASTLQIRGLTTADPSASGLGSFSPKPLIVDEMFARDESPMSDIETESGHSSSSDHSGVSGGGKTRKSSMPKRLRLGSEASSPGLEEDDRDKKEMEDQHEESIAVSEDEEEEQPMDFTKTKLDSPGLGMGAARFSILGSYLKSGREHEKLPSLLGLQTGEPVLDSALTGSWLEPLANLARSAPRPASRDSRGDSKDEREDSGEDVRDQKEVKDRSQAMSGNSLGDSLEIANKLRSHFLANLPASSYAWLNGMTGVSGPSLSSPGSYPGSWLGLTQERGSRHQPTSILDAVKLDKHPLGGIRTGEIGANGKPTVKCEVCGKKLADPSSLYRHRKIHSGDKPHKCPYCERRFIQRYNMKQHIKTHRIELMASDQKPGAFPMGKKGRPASISSPFSVSSPFTDEGLPLDMSH